MYGIQDIMYGVQEIMYDIQDIMISGSPIYKADHQDLFHFVGITYHIIIIMSSYHYYEKDWSHWDPSGHH